VCPGSYGVLDTPEAPNQPSAIHSIRDGALDRSRVAGIQVSRAEWLAVPDVVSPPQAPGSAVVGVTHRCGPSRTRMGAVRLFAAHHDPNSSLGKPVRLGHRRADRAQAVG